MATTKTKLMSGFVALLMLISMFAMFVIPASAAATTGGIVVNKGLHDATGYPDITTYSDSVKVYSIKNRAGMEKIATLVNKDNKTLSGVTIYQIADIDMEGTPFGGIGYGGFTRKFSGTFDGNGYTIDNLFVVRTSDAYHQSVALFGCADGAYFKNIGISGGLIVGTNWTGSIAGRSQYCKFSNCWNAATVIGQDDQGTGGIAGTNIGGSSYMVNCYNVGLIYSGTSKASGIVGWINNAADKVVSCYTAGEIVSGSRSYVPTSKEGHIYAPIVCQLLTEDDGKNNANNYFIKGRGGAQKSSYELIKVDKATVIPDTETKLNGTHDGTVGLEASALTDGTLATKLNAGFAAEGAIDGYTIAFENVEGIGYPVLTYRKDGAIVAQRYAKDNTNVNGAKTWEDSSPFFAWLKSISNSGGQKLKASVTLTTADDVFLFGALTYGASISGTYKITEIKLGADVDIAERASHTNLKYAVPLGVSNEFTGITFDGQNHVIKNWKSCGIGFGANYCAGFIAKTNGTTTVKNLGLVNAESCYDAAAAFAEAYIYPSLIVERNNGGLLTMENCFATGNLVCDGVTNHNNDSAIFSTTWADNLKINNCWGQATWSVPGGVKAAVRTVGKLPSTYKVVVGKDEAGKDITENRPWIYTGDVTNIYILNTSNYGTLQDQQADKFQTLAPEQSVANRSTLYWLTNTANMPALYRLDADGDIAFATEANAIRKLTVNKKMSANAIAESIVTYVHSGDAITIEAIDGYALDESTIPEGGTAAGFTMPAADVVLDYMIQEADYTVAEGLLATYNSYDKALFTDPAAIEKVIADAQAIVALKNQGQTAEVVANAINATAALVEYENGLNLTLKNTYPNIVKVSELDRYAQFHDGKNYGVSTYEDWVAITKMANTDGLTFSGKTIHLLNDVDMGNKNVDTVNGRGNATFAGTFDGHNHVFKNLKIEVAASPSHPYIGLFGFAKNATFKNFGIESGSVKNTSATNHSKNEIHTGAVVGFGESCKVYNVWNAANVDSGIQTNTSTSGIGRLTENSFTDFIFNVGNVRALGNGAGLSGYSQGKTTYFNSFDAAASVQSALPGAVRHNTDNLQKLHGNVFSAGHVWDGQYSHSSEKAAELNYADYESGKIAWLLNTGYISGKGGTRAWYTNDPVAKTIRFGTEATQTRKITLVSATGTWEQYAAQGSVVTLAYPATGTITYALAEGAVGTLAGDQLTVGAGDVTVNVTFTGVDLSKLTPAAKNFEGMNDLDKLTTSAGKTVAATLTEVIAKAADGSFADQAEVDAYTAQLTAGVTCMLPMSQFLAHEVINHKGYLISDDYKTHTFANYTISNNEEMKKAVEVRSSFYATQTLYLTADLDLNNDAAFARFNGFKGTIDGQGHTIKNVSISDTAGWFGDGSLKGMKNITLENWKTTTARVWQGGLLMRHNNGTDLVFENVTIKNATVTGGGANGLGLFVGMQDNWNEKVTFKNVVVEGSTFDRGTKSGNSGLLVGRNQYGTVIIDGAVLRGNTLTGGVTGGGSALMMGECTGHATVKNVLMENNTIKTVYGLAIGALKVDDGSGVSNTVTVDNVVSYNNGSFGVIYRSNTNANCKYTLKNVYTLTDLVSANEKKGPTATEAGMASGEYAYAMNANSTTKKWELANGKYPTFDTDNAGLPVKVEFVNKEEKAATLYTNTEGKLIGLTAELLNAAKWENEEELATKAYTADAVVNAVNDPTFAVGSTVGKNEETVTVPVTLENNLGYTGAEFKVTYDPAALTLEEVVKGDNEALIVVGDPVIENGLATVEVALINVDENMTPVLATEDGIFANLKFAVNKTAAKGNYTVGVELVEMVGEEGNYVEVKSAEGTVTVECNFKLVAPSNDVKPEEAAHYTECGCGEKTQPVKCSETEGWTYAKEDATCTTAGSITASCAVCGYNYSETIDALAHKMTKTDAKEATCTTDGNYEYYTCDNCGKVFKDAEGKTETTVAAETIAALGHKMTKIDAKEATCTEAGNVEYYTCSVCGKNFADAEGKTELENVVIAAKGHTLTKVEAKEPTFEEEGNNEYYICHCGAAFKDAEGTIPTTVEEETLSKKSYMPGDVTGDGKVSILDAVYAMRIAAGEENLPAHVNPLAADVTNEGDTETMQVNTADVVLIMQYLVGKAQYPELVSTAEALTNALTDADVREIVFVGDVTLAEAVKVTTDKVIDFNGHKFTAKSGSRPFQVYGADITIDATGSKVALDKYGFVDIREGSDVNVTIIGGTFTGELDNGAVIKGRANTNATIYLKDVNLSFTDSSTKGSYVYNPKDVAEDGYATVTVDGGVYNIDNGFLCDVTLKNATVNAKGFIVNGGGSVENSALTTDGSSKAPFAEAPFCCVAASHGRTVTVTNSTLTATNCHAIEVYPTGGTVTVVGSTVNGTCHKYAADANHQGAVISITIDGVEQ